MNSKRNDSINQKVTLALFFIKENNISQLFGKWIINIGKKYLLGRKDADINIDNPLISRRHLEITFYTFNQIKIKDLGSRNGTFINNSKATPNQEIKFTSNDKLSLGDINNKIVFLEYQEPEKSVFNNNFNEIKDTNDQKNSESTKIIENNNKRRPQYNNSYERYKGYYNRYNNRFRYRFRRRFRKNVSTNFRPRAQSYIRKSPDFEKKDRDIHSDNLYDSLSDEITNINKTFSIKSNDKSYDKYLKKEIEEKKKELIGKKLERNQSKNEDNKLQKKNLVKLIRNKKLGLEILKRKLKNLDNEEKENAEEEVAGLDDEINIIDLDEKLGNKNGKILLKSKNLENLEFVLNANEKNVKNLKKVKQIKYLVNGYLVLDVKKKTLIFDE